MESQLMILGKVLVAMVLGSLVGLERELARKPSGVRTNMLVAGAVALVVMLGEALTFRYDGSEIAGFITSDPTRILQAIIVGVSFVGAGTIIQREKEERVENLTTAATILFVTGIAVAVAIDLYILAVGLTALDLLVTFVLGRAIAKTGWGKDHQR